MSYSAVPVKHTNLDLRVQCIEWDPGDYTTTSQINTFRPGGGMAGILLPCQFVHKLYCLTCPVPTPEIYSISHKLCHCCKFTAATLKNSSMFIYQINAIENTLHVLQAPPWPVNVFVGTLLEWPLWWSCHCLYNHCMRQSWHAVVSWVTIRFIYLCLVMRKCYQTCLMMIQ